MTVRLLAPEDTGTPTEQMGTQQLPRWLGRAVFLVWALVACAGMVYWMTNPAGQFVVTGAIASLIVTFPLLRRDYFLFSPWSLLAFSVYVGSGLRGTFIGLGIEDDEKSLDTLFLLGRGPDFFLWPSALHLGALVIVAVVYMHASKGVSREAARQYRFHRGALPVTMLFAALGLVALVLFAQQTGGFSLDELSRKRTTITGLDLAEDYESHGELRFLAEFSAASFWVVTAWIAQRSRHRRLRVSEWVLLVLFALNAVAFPVYASSRTSASLSLLVAWGIFASLRKHGALIRMRAVLVVLVTIGLLFGTMTVLRANAQGGTGGEVVSGSTILESSASSLVYNRNLGDMQVTSHVVHAVPSVIPFQNGATLYGWLLAPIPRSVWPEKPIVNVGPLVGVYIYGNTRSGVPPGLVGDSYLNFGTSGVIVLSAIGGVLLGRLERWRRGTAAADLGLTVAYMSFGLKFGLQLMSKGVGAALFQSVYQLVPVVVVLLAAGAFQRAWTSQHEKK